MQTPPVNRQLGRNNAGFRLVVCPVRIHFEQVCKMYGYPAGAKTSGEEVIFHALYFFFFYSKISRFLGGFWG